MEFLSSVLFFTMDVPCTILSTLWVLFHLILSKPCKDYYLPITDEKTEAWRS